MKHFATLVAVILTHALLLQGQSVENRSMIVNPIITDADIINASVLVDPLAEKIKDIAPTTFSLQFINKSQKPIKASMQLEAYVTLEEDQRKEGLFTEPARTKKPFLIAPEGRIFTSKDAGSSNSGVDMRASVNESLKKRLKDKILEVSSGGRAPSGLYEIRIVVTVDSVDGQSVTDDPIVIERSVNVTNPTTAVLDVPFNNGYIYPTPFPQFQWTYDTRLVSLKVYELRPEHQSLEDAIGASDPYLEVEINRKESGNMTSFTYPQSSVFRSGVKIIRGPRQLERGKMYVVVLDGIRTAYGYEVDPLRTVRSFAIADPQGQVILNVLQTTFGGGDFQSFLNLIQDQNLRVNASGITLNGVTLSPQDLQKLLMEFKSRITAVRMEE